MSKVTSNFFRDKLLKAPSAGYSEVAPLPKERVLWRCRRGSRRSSGIIPTLDRFLPLPAGEGWGEGDAPPLVRLVLKLTNKSNYARGLTTAATEFDASTIKRLRKIFGGDFDDFLLVLRIGNQLVQLLLVRGAVHRQFDGLAEE